MSNLIRKTVVTVTLLSALATPVAKAGIIGMVSASGANSVKIEALRTDYPLVKITQSSNSCGSIFTPGTPMHSDYIVERDGKTNILVSLYVDEHCDQETHREARTQAISLTSLLNNSAFDQARAAINTGDVMLHICIQVFPPGAHDASLACGSIDLPALMATPAVVYQSPQFPTPPRPTPNANLDGDARYNVCAAQAKAAALRETRTALHLDADARITIVRFESYQAPFETVAPWFWYLVAVDTGTQTKTWYVEAPAYSSAGNTLRCGDDEDVSVMENRPALWPHSSAAPN